MRIKRVIKPPVYLLVTIIAMIALHFYYPLAIVFASPFKYYAAGLFIFIGLFLDLWSVGKFLVVKTGLIPFRPSTTLVTTGMYRLTRNPMYLGMVISLLGIAILFGSLSPFLVIPLFVWVIHVRFIKYEELFLEDIFGEHYREYRARVRRWL